MKLSKRFWWLLVAASTVLIGLAIYYEVRFIPQATLTRREEAALAELLQSNSVILPMTRDSEGIFVVQGAEVCTRLADEGQHPTGALGYLPRQFTDELVFKYPNIRSPSWVMRIRPRVVHIFAFLEWDSEDTVQVLAGSIETNGGGGWSSNTMKRVNGKWSYIYKENQKIGVLRTVQMAGWWFQ